jgi:hypothetical protein
VRQVTLTEMLFDFSGGLPPSYGMPFVGPNDNDYD